MAGKHRIGQQFTSVGGSRARGLHRARPTPEPSGWVAAGVVALGIGVAMSTASGVARADSGSADSASGGGAASDGDTAGPATKSTHESDTGTESAGTAASSAGADDTADTSPSRAPDDEDMPADLPAEAAQDPEPHAPELGEPDEDAEGSAAADGSAADEDETRVAPESPVGVAPVVREVRRSGAFGPSGTDGEAAGSVEVPTAVPATAALTPRAVEDAAPAAVTTAAPVVTSAPIAATDTTPALTDGATIAAPAAGEATETASESPIFDALAPLFGSAPGGGDMPVDTPVEWILAAAARNEFDTDDSLQGNLLRVSAETGEPGLVLDGSLATGESPSGVAVSGDRVYVTNHDSGTMTIYRRADHTVLATVAVGATPSAVVLNAAGTRAYIANRSAGTVTVLDTASYAVVARIKVGAAPSALALTPDGRRLLVVNSGSNTVTKIDAVKNRVSKSAIRVGGSPSSIAVSADSRYAYVTNAADGTVTVITLSYSKTKTIGGVGASPTDSVISGGKLYVSGLGGAVTVIAIPSNSVIGQLSAGAPVRSLALSADGATLFAATPDDTVLAIDIATATAWSVVDTDPTPETAQVPSLAVAADGTVYQTDAGDNALRVLFVGEPGNQAPTIDEVVVGDPDAQTGVVTGRVVVTDPDPDALQYTVTTRPQYGAVTLDGDGNFTYTPSLIGQLTATDDYFVVTVSDGQARVLSTTAAGVAVAVLPAQATLKTGTFTFETPGLVSHVGKSAEYTRRKLMEFPVEPAKMRVHLGNFNMFQDAMVKKGSLDEVSLWIGEAAYGADGRPTGQFVPGTQVQIPIASTLAAGQWGVSDWVVDGVDIDFDPDKQYIFSYAFGTPGGKVASVTGGGSVGWTTKNAGDAGADGVALTYTTNAYLDVWFEYQYKDTGQPSIFVVSNSSAYNLSGTSNTRGELDTWVNQWAEQYGGVVAGNIATSAVWATAFDGGPTERWDFYNGKLEIPLDPDVVVYMAINSSDASSGTGSRQLAKIKQDTINVLASGQQVFPNALHVLSEIPPRKAFKSKKADAQRKALNAWMNTLPGGADAIIPIGAVLGDGRNPERLLKVYSDDGTHWSPAGVLKVVELMGPTIAAALLAEVPLGA